MDDFSSFQSSGLSEIPGVRTMTELRKDQEEDNKIRRRMMRAEYENFRAELTINGHILQGQWNGSGIYRLHFF
jgi:hypothetical protein